MARIAILIGSHLATAPRPVKEADALSAAGHAVTVMGVSSDRLLARRDQLLSEGKRWTFDAVSNFSDPPRLRSKANNWARCLRGRFMREVFRRTGVFSPFTLCNHIEVLLNKLQRFGPDLTIVHSEGGLWIGNQLLDRGFPVGVDFEDWFSEDLLPPDRRYRPLKRLKELEARLARECKYSVTTSNALADAIAQAYQSKRPSVAYNVFPIDKNEQVESVHRDRADSDATSLHWFSQTIGPGRGLELLFKALPQVTANVQLHLRGNHNDGTLRWIDSLIPHGFRSRLHVHHTVNNRELPGRIAEHDIGLALEQSYCPSRDLTVSNKLFQYLQAGLAVIATNTTGQNEVMAKCEDAGRLVPNHDIIALARAIDELSVNSNLQRAKSAARDAATNRFNWEHESKTIVALVNHALA